MSILVATPVGLNRAICIFGLFEIQDHIDFVDFLRIFRFAARAKLNCQNYIWPRLTVQIAIKVSLNIEKLALLALFMTIIGCSLGIMVRIADILCCIMKVCKMILTLELMVVLFNAFFPVI